MSVFTYHGDVDTVMTPLDSIRYIKSFLRSGFVSMDPHNGAVKAYVGGVDFTHFTYDMATQGRRQVGSTIKPFLYALSMSNGMSPCDVAPNVQRSYGNWTPRMAVGQDMDNGNSEMGTCTVEQLDICVFDESY